MKKGRNGPRQPGGGRQTPGPRKGSPKGKPPTKRGGRQDRQRVPGEERAESRGKGRATSAGARTGRGKPARDAKFGDVSRDQRGKFGSKPGARSGGKPGGRSGSGRFEGGKAEGERAARPPRNERFAEHAGSAKISTMVPAAPRTARYAAGAPPARPRPYRLLTCRSRTGRQGLPPDRAPGLLPNLPRWSRLTSPTVRIARRLTPPRTRAGAGGAAFTATLGAFLAGHPLPVLTAATRR